MTFSRHRRIKRTKKQHRCEHCGLHIPKGVSCDYDSGKYDGEFFSLYQHSECLKEYCRINKDSFDEWFRLSDCDEKPGYFKKWKERIRGIYSLEELEK